MYITISQKLVFLLMVQFFCCSVGRFISVIPDSTDCTNEVVVPNNLLDIER
jgi:hypothetical protein